MKEGNLLFGEAQTVKLLKQDKLEEVFVSTNYPTKAHLKKLAEISKTKITVLKETNEELGALCKKPFSIAIIGLKKA